MLATYTKFQTTVENLAEKVFNLGSDQLKVALTNSAPLNTYNQLSQVTEISYTNLSSRNITTNSSAQTSGTYKLVVADLVLTSSGGTTGPFRYIVVYDDTAASDQLIAYFDYGSALTLNDSDTLTLDFDGTNGLLQIT